MSSYFVIYIVIISCGIFGQPEVKYLQGVHRLNDSSYIDNYLSCNVKGNFLQWEVNGTPLTGFTNEDAGKVIVITKSTFKYTASLLSSQPDLETDQNMLDSLLIISIDGHHEYPLDVVCSSSLDSSTTTQVKGLLGTITSISSSNGEVVLGHIVSTEIVYKKNKTHIFMCGVQNDRQFLEISGRSPIGFNENDSVGIDRTVLRDNVVRLQGVLIAEHPFRRTSVLFIPDDMDVTVICFFEMTQVLLNSSQASIEEVPITREVPVDTGSTTSTLSGSSEHGTKTGVSSSTTDGPRVTENSNRAGMIVGVISVVGVPFVLILFVIFINLRCKRAPGSTSVEDGYESGTTSSTVVEEVNVLCMAESRLPKKEDPPLKNYPEQKASGGETSEGNISGGPEHTSEEILDGTCLAENTSAHNYSESNLVFVEPGGSCLVADGDKQNFWDSSGTVAEKSLCGQNSEDSVCSLSPTLGQSGYFLDVSSEEPELKDYPKTLIILSVNSSQKIWEWPAISLERLPLCQRGNQVGDDPTSRTVEDLYFAKPNVLPVVPGDLVSTIGTSVDTIRYVKVYSNLVKKKGQISLVIMKEDPRGTCAGGNYQADSLLIRTKAAQGGLAYQLKITDVTEAVELILCVVQQILVVSLYIQGVLLCHYIGDLEVRVSSTSPIVYFLMVRDELQLRQHT